MKDHIMLENNKSKKKDKELKRIFFKNGEGHSLYMIIQGTVR